MGEWERGRCCCRPNLLWLCLSSVDYQLIPLNIQPVVIVRGLKRQQAAALNSFVGCFLLALSFFSLSALNDLTGPSAGALARITFSIPFHSITN